MDKITIIDYGLGNLGSIANMIKKVGGEFEFANDTETIKKAKKILLPGVGAFDNGMGNIHRLGIRDILDKKVLEENTPILGICLGMQLLGKGSEEGNLQGFGWISAVTKKFVLPKNYAIPHMGWNTVNQKKKSPIFEIYDPETRFYFVHSYYMQCTDEQDILFQTHYGIDFTSGVHHRNIFGVQFHPEKSHRFGKQLFSNFISL